MQLAAGDAKQGRGTHLLLDEGALVVKALEDEIGDLLDDAGVGGTQELADLLELVDGRDLVVVRRDAVHHPRAPVRLHRPPALIHGCCPDRRGTEPTTVAAESEGWPGSGIGMGRGWGRGPGPLVDEERRGGRVAGEPSGTGTCRRRNEGGGPWKVLENGARVCLPSALLVPSCLCNQQPQQRFRFLPGPNTSKEILLSRVMWLPQYDCDCDGKWFYFLFFDICTLMRRNPAEFVLGFEI